MNERDEALKAFRKALEEAEQHAQGKATLLPPLLALAKCWEWLNVKAATTHSAAALETILVSLANEGEANLSYIRGLDGERRVWVASLIIGIHQLRDTELLSAAGVLGVEGSSV